MHRADNFALETGAAVPITVEISSATSESESLLNDLVQYIGSQWS